MEMEQNFFQRNKGWVIFLGIVVILALWGFSSYNSFVGMNETVDSAWAQVENQYQRRFDLIPNLEATVKGVAGQEQKVFGDIAEARTRYSGATTPEEKALATNQVESALGRLLVITENYPALQSSQAFRDLMVQLEGTENRISVERMKYNDLIKTYNTKIKSVPAGLFGRLFGFRERTYFDIKEGVENVPKVDFVN